MTVWLGLRGVTKTSLLQDRDSEPSKRRCRVSERPRGIRAPGQGIMEMPKERVDFGQPDAGLERPRDPVVARHIQRPREPVGEPDVLEDRAEGLRAERDGTAPEDNEEP